MVSTVGPLLNMPVRVFQGSGSGLPPVNTPSGMLRFSHRWFMQIVEFFCRFDLGKYCSFSWTLF